METTTKPKTDYTPAVLDEASKILLRAAAIIETGGHCKGSAESGTARCVSGAITYASKESPLGMIHGHDTAIDKFRRAVPQIIPWNDAPERTQAEVVAKMRAVALYR